jgi:hypothetical protein
MTSIDRQYDFSIHVPTRATWELRVIASPEKHGHSEGGTVDLNSVVKTKVVLRIKCVACQTAQ